MSSLRVHIVTIAIAFRMFAVPVSVTAASLDDAKTLYAAASFESALAVLGQLDAEAGTRADAFEYTALCLIALGRSAEAQTIVDALVAGTPTFLPTGEEVSPRFMALLNDARRRLLPEIAKQLFNDAREQFRAKNNQAAREGFEQVLRLVDDASWGDSSDGEDLRTLASGFIELVASSDAAIVLPARVAEPTPAVESVVAPPAAPARQRIELQSPVPIEQVMPKWRPTDTVTAQRHFTGAVRVRIGTNGRVVHAAIEVPTDPAYDRTLLDAAKSWRYMPARRNGEPIEMDKLVIFSLRMH
jgi:TonB family protein